LLLFHISRIVELPGWRKVPGRSEGQAMRSQDETRTLVRERYGAIARDDSSCCAPSCCNGVDMAPDGLNVIGDAYAGIEGRLAEADLSLGCGVPTRYAALRPGETVLDLGSGAGNDVFIARHEVGPAGRVIGVDMTPDMIAKARENARKLGFANVEFRLGEIEHLPVEVGTVDIVISNCVLNLLPDKAPAFIEMFRVLKPGGRFCISDIVATGELPEQVREAAGLYVGCIAGALPEADYLGLIDAAGFTAVRIAEAKPIPLPDDALAPHMDADQIAAFRTSGIKLKSVTVLGTKPER
jgi:SAM-dependent methyltransferase